MDSYDLYAKKMMIESGFLNMLLDFAVKEKDNINEETMEGALLTNERTSTHACASERQHVAAHLRVGLELTSVVCCVSFLFVAQFVTQKLWRLRWGPLRLLLCVCSCACAHTPRFCFPSLLPPPLSPSAAAGALPQSERLPP